MLASSARGQNVIFLNLDRSKCGVPFTIPLPSSPGYTAHRAAWCDPGPAVPAAGYAGQLQGGGRGGGEPGAVVEVRGGHRADAARVGVGV